MKTRPFDVVNSLFSEEDMIEYLRQVVEDNDPALLAGALGDIVRARSMTKLAKDTGLPIKTLHQDLSGERAPGSDTLFKVMRALGFKLTMQPVTPHH